MDPLIITVAGVGAEVTPAQQPNLPITPEQVGADAAACAAAGASIYHLHVRTPQGEPTMGVAAVEAARDAIRQSSDLIVQFTTGGAVGDSDEERLAPLALCPEMASLTTGTVNFGSGVFWNPPALVERLYLEMRSKGVVPEFEIFEAGMIANALKLVEEHGDGHHLHFDLVLGVPGALPAWPDSIGFLAAHLPPDASWSATGIGRSHLQVATEAIARGGHVRTGFEDVRYLGPGEPATSNAQLIERVASMAADAGRPVATPSEARSLLAIPGPR
jgi:3-keto-5-aminohexanoate cleavage enzyme